MKGSLQGIGLVVILCLTAIVYADHFHGAFHIDDIHTIVNNAYIRDLHNVPLFFADGTTSSTLPANQTYRPLLTTTLALDYHLGGGTADTLVYHITGFTIFLSLGICLFLLFRRIYSSTGVAAAPWVALLGTAWFMLHPLSAETVCYIIQRGDLLATFLLVVTLLLYVQVPAARRYYLYLIPAALAILTKPIAVVWPLLLLAYVLIYEEADGGRRSQTLSHVVLSGALAAALGMLVYTMTPDTYQLSGADAWLYRVTQPYVLAFYAVEWFAPLWLAADHASQVFSSPFVPLAWLGYAFIAALVAVIAYTARLDKMRPIAYGLAWYLIGNLTTSWISLGEVATDHRMFLPSVGLALAVSWALYLIVEALGHRLRAMTVVSYVAMAIAGVGLLCYAYGAHERVLVWQTEESLWADAVAKHPDSQRAHLDYGLALLRRRALSEAEREFAAVLRIQPDYHLANLDMGIVQHEQGKDAESGTYLRRAVETGRDACPPCYYYYAMYLRQQGQIADAITYVAKAYQLSTANVEARELLMELLFQQHRIEELRKVVRKVLVVSPGDSRATYYQGLLASAPATTAVPATAESLLDLSGQAYREGRYQDCIDYAQKALALKPDFAEGYNNLAAACNKLGKYAEAKQAASQALKLDPHSRFAQINLAAAEQGLRSHAR